MLQPLRCFNLYETDPNKIVADIEYAAILDAQQGEVDLGYLAQSIIKDQ